MFNQQMKKYKSIIVSLLIWGQGSELQTNTAQGNQNKKREKEYSFLLSVIFFVISEYFILNKHLNTKEFST